VSAAAIRRLLGPAWLLAFSQAFLLVAVASPFAARASHVEFGQPEAEAILGEPIVFSTTLEAAGEPPAVELVLRAPDERAVSVLPADVTNEGGSWRAEATLEGHTPPNTRFHYRFRLNDPKEGVLLGPEAEAVLTDDRFAWQTIEGGVVRLHWYEGSEQFARRALEIGQGAIDEASELLGVTETEPIDFFIYDSATALRVALGPGTRENVAGQAHADIRTLFGLIEPNEVESAWVDTLVVHELTHLVFNTATDNDYHSPPRWLNEGVAVLLSEGYNASWQAVMNEAVRDGAVIPLQGLGGLFPTTRDQFQLAYGESVSAVSFFIDAHGEPTLWSLVGSYAQGVSDDDAFRAATGADLAAFNEAWMASLGLDVPDPIGPQPGAPGPLPPGWDGALPGPGPTAGPGTTPAAPATPAAPGTPGATTGGGERPTDPAEPGESDGLAPLVIGFVAGLIVIVAVVLIALRAQRRRPEPPPWG
jgi:hypothetical protein